MKKYERSWIIWIVICLSISIVLTFIFGIKILGFTHFFNIIAIVGIYCIISSKKIRHLEKVCPQKGEECFGYIYNKQNGDNGFVIYSVVVYLERDNMNKLVGYKSFVNTKLKCKEVVKGYYYKDKVVLDKKSIDKKDLPQNIIDAFELYNEE